MNMKDSLGLSKFFIIVLAVALIIMSVGYASFSRTLNITGQAEVGASSWKIKFDEATYNETGSVAASGKTILETSFDYTISLAKPGDVYEATVDVKNDGTFDADLTGITMSALSEAQQKYLVYEVYYNGTKYTSTSDISGVVLEKGKSAPVKVKVQYIQPASEADLPATAENITLTASLNFAQSVE